MSIVIDLLVLCLTCGFAVLGVRIGLRRTIVLGMLAIPAFAIGTVICLPTIGLVTLPTFSPVSLLAFMLPAFLTFWFLWLLLRLRPDRHRVSFIVQSILLRIWVSLAYAISGIVAIVLLFRALLTPASGAGWPCVAAFGALLIAVIVALHLLIGRLWKWRQAEPAWFGKTVGRLLGGLLGLGYALLLLTVLVPLSCTSSFVLPGSALLSFDDEQPDDAPLIVEPPPEFVAAVVRSRLAYRFLNPADGRQCLLLSVRIPGLGTAITQGNLSAAHIPGYESVSGEILPSKSSLARIVAAAPARLTPGRPDCLVVRDSEGFNVLQFRDSLWMSFGRVSFNNPYAQPARGRTAWGIGDVDDDGRDEVVAGDSNRFVVFQWQDTGFSRRAYDFRYQIDNVTVGDINNDGHNEVIVLASDEKLVDGFERERVCILRLGPTGVELLGNDLGRLALGDNRVTPADELLAVADVENRHVNELLVYRPANDESQPLSVYSLLSGNDNQLRILRTFSIANGRLVSPKRAAGLANALEIGSDIGGPLAVARLQGQTVCLARTFYILEERPFGRVSLVAIEHGRLRVMGQLLPPIRGVASLADAPFKSVAHFLQIDHSDQTSQLCWLDPDGRGPAALRIAPSWRAPPRYILDRVGPAQPESTGHAR